MKVFPLHTSRIVYCVVGIYFFALLFTKRWFGPITLDLKKNEDKMTHVNIATPVQLKMFLPGLVQVNLSIYLKSICIGNRMNASLIKNLHYDRYFKIL